MERVQPLSLASPVWDARAWEHWREYLDIVEQNVYKGLRTCALEGNTEVDLYTFAKRLAISQSALVKALHRLENLGLLEDVSE